MVEEHTNVENACNSEANFKSIDVLFKNVTECICDCNTQPVLQDERSSINLSINNKHFIETNDNAVDTAKHNQTWSTGASVSDVVCLGATVIIVLIQLSVLIFYVFKDHESPEEKL